jgi:phosphate-selective porin
MRRILESCLLLCLALPALASAQPSATVTPAGKEPTLTLGGLLQAQAEFGDAGDARFANDNDRFYLRRARLTASGRFLEEFDFRLELDLAGSIANTTGLRAQMTDGYINWNRNPAANIRVGQFKTPFGFEQLYRDPLLYSAERSLVNDRLTLGRQLGVQVGGDLLDKRLSYAAGVFNGNGANNNFNDDDRFLTAGRLSGIPWSGKLLGRSASWSVGGDLYRSTDTNIPQGSEFGFDSTPQTADRDNVFSGTRRGWGLDSQITAGPFELWAEYLATRWEPTSALPRREIESDGWYAQGALFVVPDRVQVILKYETFDPRHDRTDDATNTGTAGVTWYLKGHDLKLLADYLRIEKEARPSEDKLIARLQVNF